MSFIVNESIPISNIGQPEKKEKKKKRLLLSTFLKYIEKNLRTTVNVKIKE